MGNYDLQFKLKITFNSFRILCLYSSTAVSKEFVGPMTGSDKPTCLPRNYKNGGPYFLHAVIVLPSGFAVSPDFLTAVPAHGNGVSW